MADQRLTTVGPVRDEGTLETASFKGLRDLSVVSLLNHSQIPEEAEEIIRIVQTEQSNNLPLLEDGKSNDLITLNSNSNADNIENHLVSISDTSDELLSSTINNGHMTTLVTTDSNALSQNCTSDYGSLTNDQHTCSQQEDINNVTVSLAPPRTKTRKKFKIAATFGSVPLDPQNIQESTSNITEMDNVKNEKESLLQPGTNTRKLNSKSWTNKKPVIYKGETPISVFKSPVEEYYQLKSETSIAKMKKQIKLLRHSLLEKEELNELVAVDDSKSRTINMVINSSLQLFTSSFWHSKYNEQLEGTEHFAKYKDCFESQTLKSEEKYLRYLLELHT